MLDVVTIGAATIDIFVKSKEFVTNSKLLSLKYSSKSEISQSLICSGGGATNSAVSFNRLGLKSACLSLIGDDHLSKYIIDDLKKESVSTNLIIKNKKDTTDFSVILVAPDGSRSILVNRGSTCLKEKDINWDKITKAKWFYITSLEGNIDLLEKLIGFAKENDIKIALNPGNREFSQRRKLIPLLKLVDFLLLNKTEAEMLTDINIGNKNFWSQLTSFSKAIISVTSGREGAFIVTNDGKHYFSPAINAKPIDETGAGDSFGSTFVSALLYKYSPQEALFWAIKNSASVVSALGAKTKLFTLSQINKK
jgi:ribokinase